VALRGAPDGQVGRPDQADLVGALTRRLHRLGHAARREDEDPVPSHVYATMHLPRSDYADLAGRTLVLWEKREKKGRTHGKPEPAAHPVWTGQGGVAAAPAKRSRKTASRATEARKAGRSAR
jgi:hypothetical protein